MYSIKCLSITISDLHIILGTAQQRNELERSNFDLERDDNDVEHKIVEEPEDREELDNDVEDEDADENDDEDDGVDNGNSDSNNEEDSDDDDARGICLYAF